MQDVHRLVPSPVAKSDLRPKPTGCPPVEQKEKRIRSISDPRDSARFSLGVMKPSGRDMLQSLVDAARAMATSGGGTVPADIAPSPIWELESFHQLAQYDHVVRYFMGVPSENKHATAMMTELVWRRKLITAIIVRRLNIVGISLWLRSVPANAMFTTIMRVYNGTQHVEVPARAADGTHDMYRAFIGPSGPPVSAPPRGGGRGRG
eukprot:TRINITY_DN5272_c0_g1_i2.p1 TRINITY_DN5272_c0_g1~~TRINITY_DN5272_c0_g1_i2.p1  ORF type:complete len:206 (-),score=11.73 TRINITY_DN5272_c0_g1_i2:88-705(-)